MKICLITETLDVGGAETFVVRLANALSRSNEVVLINIWPHKSRKAVMDQVAATVKLINIQVPMRLALQKSDAVLRTIKIDFSFTDQYIINTLAKLMAEEKPDAVHTHLFNPDLYISRLKKDFGFRHITTCHGDYLMYEEAPPRFLLNYEQKRNFIFNELDAFVTISDVQLQWIINEVKNTRRIPPVSKILNGYSSGEYTARTRSQLGIPENALVFGMVSRGIPEKGWQFLVNAFLQNAAADTYLVLVGEGPEIDRLKSEHDARKNILFIGYAERPIEYISLFDVGLLPSVYRGESLPTVIIEYLYCGKPVIATDLGEIKKMVSSGDNETAGDIIACPDLKIDEPALAAAMRRYSDREYLAQKAAYTNIAFKKFDMQSCIDSYIALYNGSGKQ